MPIIESTKRDEGIVIHPYMFTLEITSRANPDISRRSRKLLSLKNGVYNKQEV